MILALLAGLALVNLSGVGSYQSFMYLAVLLVLIHGLRSLWRHRSVPPAAAWLALVPATFVLCDLLAPDGAPDKNAVRNLLAFVAIAGALWMLPRRLPGDPLLLHATVVGLVAAAAVAQSIAMAAFQQPFGLFDNPHFVALSAVAAIPIMAHASLCRGLVRGIGLVGLAAGLLNLARVDTIIGWIALSAAAAVVLLAYLPRGARLLVSTGLIIVAVAVIAYPPLNAIYEEPVRWVMQELIAGVDPDERITLWVEAWQLQQQATGWAWLFGHGLGAFSEQFLGYTYSWLDFPHHFFLETLFNSGLLGLLALVLALGALGATMMNHTRAGRDRALLAAALLVAVGVFTFLTLPLTSRPTTHALGFAVGFALWTRKLGDPHLSGPHPRDTA